MRAFFLSLLLIPLVGCDSRIEEFEPNQVYALTLARSRSTPTDLATQDASAAVNALFGTPNQPRWPIELWADSRVESLVDPENLTRAAGPVSSGRDGTHQGLFREHCVICHGLAGSGAGPASSVQNPYPRDFRHGVFKWKSTERGSKPTRDDLRKLLQRGVPGTAMPSFSLLNSADLESLIDYIIYLSVRGESERRLIAAAIDELDYAETPPDDGLRLSHLGGTEGGELTREVVSAIVESWREADSRTVAVSTWTPLAGDPLRQSIGRGKEIFHGQIANCTGCHGPAGNGELATLDYDDWTKEFSTRVGLTPSDREAMRPFRDAGALRPLPLKPRKLQDGVFRGAGDAETLYRRITQGIAGTPMPGVEVVAVENGKGLTDAQVWDLVRYIQSLAPSQ